MRILGQYLKFGKKIQGIHILVSKKTSRGRFNLDAKKIVLRHEDP